MSCLLLWWATSKFPLPCADEAIVKNFTAFHQGDTTVLFQWHASVNLTQAGTAFSYFHLTRLRQGFSEETNITLAALCSNSTMTEFCHKWEGFAAGANYSVWIEMVYSYPATGGRVGLTVTIPPGVYAAWEETSMQPHTYPYMEHLLSKMAQ